MVLVAREIESVDVPPVRLARRLVILLAVAVGAVIANLYYIHPLLDSVARVFGVSDTAAGLLVTCTQVGYAAGLIVLVPVGDIVERRRLIVAVLLAAAGAAAVCAAAPTLGVLAAGLAALGLLSVAAAILVVLAATLASADERGQVVGTVMSGLLLGILLARVVSGLVAGLGGFRLVFAMAAGALFVLALLLGRALPRVPPGDRLPYRRALPSVLRLVATEPVLRQRMALGFLLMGGFTVLWTTSAFLLAGAPYHYDKTVIGLFGLAGVAGALVTPLAGRAADRGRGRRAMSLFLIAILASWALLALGRESLIALAAGMALLDFGVNGAQVSNQAVIYALRPEARNRMTTAYSMSFFTGGAAGSLLAAAVYGSAGWGASCVLGAALAAVALAVWTATRHLPGGNH